MGRFLAVLVCLSVSGPSLAKRPKIPPKPLANALEKYRWFHQHPELSGKEVKTAARLADALRGLGMEVTEGVGGTGIIGILRNGPGPTVLYRADMDGLPVTEKNRVPYVSQNVGVMHACGHDIHMASAVGAMTELSQTRNSWKGTILFVGQPAEETGAGARSILADPKFKKILRKVGKPKVAVALHSDPGIPAGDIAIAGGWVNANVDSVDIIIHGKGGHGARPNQAIDPVVIGAHIVTSLQTIVARRLDPKEPAVVTVGSFIAGKKHNIIPPKATLLLTVRSYSDATRKKLLGEIRRIAANVAKSHGAPKAPTIKIRDEFTPAAYNDPAFATQLESEFKRALGSKHVHKHIASMGGEDFGRYARSLKIPGVMWRLGTTDPRLYRRSRGKNIPGLHSDLYRPAPRPTLQAGIKTVVTAIKAGLRR